MTQPKIRPVLGEVRTYEIVGTGFTVKREDANFVGQSHSWVLLDEQERLVHRGFTRAAVLMHFAEHLAGGAK